jgi:predicted transcriptional regulator
MPKSKFDDKDLALLNARGLTHQQMADELGVSRVAVSKRIAKLKETNPWMLELTTVDKFREGESDMVASVRQMLLEALKNKTHKNLQQMSVNQLATAYAILWDKDEKIQDRQLIKREIVKKIDFTPDQQEMMRALIEDRTKEAIRKASQGVITESGESDDETLDAEFREIN